MTCCFWCKITVKNAIQRGPVAYFEKKTTNHYICWNLTSNQPIHEKHLCFTCLPAA